MKFTLFSIFLFLSAHFSVYANPQEFSSRSQLEEEFPCLKLCGTALQDCMKVLDNEKYKISLMHLNSEKNEMEQFLTGLLQSPEDYETFFDRFNEEEWSYFYNSLNKSELKLISHVLTKEDQLNLVNEKKFYRNLKYGGLAVGGAALVIAGGAGLYIIFYKAGSAAAVKALAEAAAAAKAAAGTATVNKVVVGGVAVSVDALLNNEKNKKTQTIIS